MTVNNTWANLFYKKRTGFTLLMLHACLKLILIFWTVIWPLSSVISLIHSKHRQKLLKF